MRILILTNYYPPFYEGGYELACQETADYLISQQHIVYVLTGIKGIPSPPVTLPVMQPGEPVRILHYIDYIHGGIFDKQAVEQFNFRITIAAIKQIKPDIIHIWGMKSVSIAPVMAVQKSGYPRLFEIGDFWPLIYRNPTLLGKINHWLKKTLPFTIGGEMIIDPVIVVSDWMKQEMQDYVGSRDIHVIPNCLLVPPDRKNKAVHHPYRFLFVGRIEPMKGLDLCIKAFGSTLKAKPDFDFVLNIYGDIEPAYHTHCLSLIMANHLDSKVHFHPRTSELDSLYWEHDVLLMPTLAREAFGRVIIEAMARRCIVIATNAYGPAEIITPGKDGFLFTRNDVLDLISKILDVYRLNADEFSAIGKAARETVQNRYEMNLIRQQTVQQLEYYKNNTSSNAR